MYAERQAALVRAAGRALAGLMMVPAAEASMHLVGWLPGRTDDRKASEAALRQGIEAPALSAYRVRPGPPGLVLGYAAFTPGELEDGVRLLARALRVPDR